MGFQSRHISSIRFSFGPEAHGVCTHFPRGSALQRWIFHEKSQICKIEDP